MKDVIDVAAYILSEIGDMSTMKLQKLVYYSQANMLVKTGLPLFENKIEAWANGPVVRDLFRAHRKKYVVCLESMDFDRKPEELDAIEQECINHVIDCLGKYTGSELSDLTHSEKPWVDARKGLAVDEPSTNEITKEAIRAYYSSTECQNCVFKVA